jgi:alpha-tubulin suppressor-like RCC1 family protein
MGQLGLGDKTPSKFNERKIPNLITSLNNVIQISSGQQHSIILKDNFQIYSFGNNGVKLLFISREVI